MGDDLHRVPFALVLLMLRREKLEIGSHYFWFWHHAHCVCAVHRGPLISMIAGPQTRWRLSREKPYRAVLR